MSAIPVLMYHALEDEQHPAGAREQGEQIYVLRAESFREQMAWLHQNGFRTLLVDELPALPVWPERAVVLTFDDGHESNYTLALPILAQYGFRAEFFLTTDWIGKPQYLKRHQIKEMHGRGMGIGSHGVSHAFLSLLEAQQLKWELSESARVIAGITGAPPSSLSCPGGRVNEAVVQMCLATGYKNLLVSRVGNCHPGDGCLDIPRIPVTADLELGRFKAMLSGGATGLLLIRLRYALAGWLRGALGNDLYQVVRRLLLKLFLSTENRA